MKVFSVSLKMANDYQTCITVLHAQLLFLLLARSTVPLPSPPLDQVYEIQLIPEGFSCTNEMPRQMDIYSTPPNYNLIKVDLVHVFCGQISYTSGNSSGRIRVGGFHARPGDQDPESATTTYSMLIRPPPNKYGYAVFRYLYVYDCRREIYMAKTTGTISSMWPTVLSMEEIAEIITRLVYVCRFVKHPNAHL